MKANVERRTYLKKIDRDFMLEVFILWNHIEKWIDQTSLLQKPELKALRYVRTYLQKVTDGVMFRLEEEQKQKVVQDLKNHQISIIDADNISMRKYVNCIYVAKDDLYDLADIVLNECICCKNESFKNCDTYKLLMRLNIPAAQQETQWCPYQN